MKKLLEITAIKMIPPKPYGMFHITFFILSILLSCILANKLKDVSDRKNKKILNVCIWNKKGNLFCYRNCS